MKEGKVGSTYVREWVSDDNKANLVIIHGAGEHSGRYIKTAENFVDKGYNVYTGDLAGHGLSDGPRIYIKSIQDYLDNVDFLISRIDNDKPVFLLGHSMGGLIALYYILFAGKDKLRGVIATSPYLQDKIKISKTKYLLAKVAAAVKPGLKIESGLKGEMLCRDEEVARRYDKDELNCSKVTAKWFIELGMARKKLFAKARDFNATALILQAGKDKAVDPEAVKSFYEAISSKDKEFVLYDDLYHEILNEPERDMVIDKINSWISERL